MGQMIITIILLNILIKVILAIFIMMKKLFHISILRHFTANYYVLICHCETSVTLYFKVSYYQYTITLPAVALNWSKLHTEASQCFLHVFRSLREDPPDAERQASEEEENDNQKEHPQPLLQRVF